MNRIKRFFDKLSSCKANDVSNEASGDESGYEFDIDEDYYGIDEDDPTRDEFVVKIQNLIKAEEFEHQLESTDIDYLVKEEPKGTKLYIFPLEHYGDVLEILNADREQIIIIQWK